MKESSKNTPVDRPPFSGKATDVVATLASLITGGYASKVYMERKVTEILERDHRIKSDKRQLAAEKKRLNTEYELHKMSISTAGMQQADIAAVTADHEAAAIREASLVYFRGLADQHGLVNTTLDEIKKRVDDDTNRLIREKEEALAKAIEKSKRARATASEVRIATLKKLGELPEMMDKQRIAMEEILVEKQGSHFVQGALSKSLKEQWGHLNGRHKLQVVAAGGAAASIMLGVIYSMAQRVSDRARDERDASGR